MRTFSLPALAGSLLTLSLASAASATDPAAYYDPIFKSIASSATGLAAALADIESNAIDHFPPGPACPAIPVGGYPAATTPRFYFLSQILPPGIGVADPACGYHLGCFLDQVPFDPNHAVATLVIDRACQVERTLVVPDRYEIAGVGLDGSGSLIFNLPDGARALRFSTAPDAKIRHSKIRDLSIGNQVCCGQTGIDISNSSLVQLANLRISGFTRGIFGKVSYMNTINGSNLSNNGFGVVLGFDTTTWRLRDSASSLNYLGGVVFDATTRQSVISGSVFEANPWAGVDVSGFGNTIEGSWFEGNAVAISNRGLIIRPGSDATAVLTSTFSIDKISDVGTNTRRCFNTTSNPPYDPNSCP